MTSKDFVFSFFLLFRVPECDVTTMEEGGLVGLVWFGLVLWHINHCNLFNAKSIFIHITSSISNNSV